MTTAGGVRIVLARSNDDDEGAEAERSARGRRRRSRRLREEQERQGAGANTSTDPETAAAAASAARLAHELSLRCTPAGPRGDRFLREMMRRSACAGRRQEEQEDEQQETTPRARRRRQHSSPRRSSSSPSAATAPLSPTTPPPLAAASATLSTAAILRARERGAAGGGGGASSSWAAQPAGFGAAARAYLTTGAFAPASVAGLGDDPRPSRAYVGFYTNSGNLFVCGYQNDRRIRVYECGPDGLGVVCGGGGSSGGGNDDVDGSGVGECGWRLVKDISCRLLRWTVTDALCVPGGGGGDGENEAKLLYSTISPTVHCVTLSSSWNDDDDDGDENGGDGDGGSGEGSNNRNRNRNDRNNRVRSIANTTDVHEPLNFDEMLGAPSDEVLPEFGIWSIRWNPVASGGGGGGGGGSGNNIGGGGGSNSIVLAGASDGCCYLFDAERGKTVARYARAHGDDVNAVVYLAGSGGGSGGSGSSSTALSSSPEVFASGSDDGYIKVWDARVPSGAAAGSSVAGNNDGATAFHAVARPVGVLVGHAAGEDGLALFLFFWSFFSFPPPAADRERNLFLRRRRRTFLFSLSSSSHLQNQRTNQPTKKKKKGITYLDARGDGHHLLSNSKDQTAKLWDLRSGLRGPAAAAAALAASPPPPPSLANFDYRWMPYPRSASGWRHGADASAVTFGGHEVLSTLIRARFSPLESTGGRFAYSGSSDG